MANIFRRVFGYITRDPTKDDVQIKAIPGNLYEIGQKGLYNLVNAYYDGTDWQRIDVDKAAHALYQTDVGTLIYAYAAAGANPITWIVLATLNNSGECSSISTKIKTYAQEAEPDIPEDTVALWHDTTEDAEHHWLVQDVGGTQYKVELT